MKSVQERFTAKVKTKERKTSKEIEEISKQLRQQEVDIDNIIGVYLQAYIKTGKINYQAFMGDIQRKLITINVDNLGQEQIDFTTDSQVKRFKANNIDRVNTQVSYESERESTTEIINRQTQTYLPGMALRKLKKYEVEYEQEREAIRQDLTNELILAGTGYAVRRVVKGAERKKVVNGLKDVDINVLPKKIDDVAIRLSTRLIEKRFVKDDKMLYFRDSSGARMAPDKLFERMISAAHYNDEKSAFHATMLEFGQDLIRISAHFDCSNLCLPYQGRIFSLSGSHKRYSPYNPILFSNGGGYRHPNCRHYETAYIEGASDNNLYDGVLSLGKKEIGENYKKRQQKNYYARQSDKYRQQAERARAIGATDLERAARQKQAGAKQKQLELSKELDNIMEGIE